MEFFHILVLAAFIVAGTAGMIALQDALVRMVSFWSDSFKGQPITARPTIQLAREHRSV